jgi:hypothetical protein
MAFQALALSLILAMAPSSADSQQSAEPTSTQEPTDLEEVEVTGEKLQKQVQAFVQDAIAAPPGRTLARWDRTFCVGASNLDARYAQYLIDRVATVALTLGLENGEPGCKPNVMVIATSDAEQLAKALVADDIYAFRPSLSATDLGTDALEQFQITDAPVRWWHVSLPVTIDTGAIAIKLSGDHVLDPAPDGPKPLIVQVRDASRIRSNTREELVRVYVIIDTTKIGQVGFSALSDYVAMVALTQIRPDANTAAHDTVLNLFSEGADRTAGLTQWDRDYLAALYAAPRDRIRLTQQQRDLTRGIASRRATRGEQTTE